MALAKWTEQTLAEHTAACTERIMAAWHARPAWSERGASWYLDYRAELDAGRPANVTLDVACAIVGLSSINTGPERGMTWTLATLHGASGGHVPTAVLRAVPIMQRAATLTFEEARELAVPFDPKGSRKVRSFACNVRTGGAPCQCEHGACVTVDRWANRIATGDDDAGVPKGAEYDAVAAAYRLAAERIGIAPAILQAILWVAVAERE